MEAESPSTANHIGAYSSSNSVAYDHPPHHERDTSAPSDSDDSSIQESPNLTATTASTIIPASSSRHYSVAGVVRSLFHAVLVQDTEHLDHVLRALTLDPNKIRDKEHKTMLMVAATENKHRVLRYLLTLPMIEVDLQDDEGETALYQAAAAGSTECVQLLILAGASALQGNEEAITPLIIASYNGFVSICRLLMKLAHVNVNQKDNTEKTALLLASYAGHLEIMAELIEHGAFLNALDQYGWSSLMLAAYAGKLDACKLLLEYGADPHIKTSNGKNARSLAWDAGHRSIAVSISKFVAKGSLPSTFGGFGVGGSGSSRPIVQPLAPAPRSPSRRTHSPAPSLPSVPEEFHEDDNYRSLYSFSGHASTVSRHSAVSSRFTSPPTTIRRLSASVLTAAAATSAATAAGSSTTAPQSLPTSPTMQPPISNAPIQEKDAPSPSGTLVATVAKLTTMFDAPIQDPTCVEIGTKSRHLETTRVIPVVQHEPAFVPQPAEWEEAGSWVHKRQRFPSVQPIYKVHRKGVIPRYGRRVLMFSRESKPTSSTESLNRVFRVHDTNSHHATERRKEMQMERHLNSAANWQLIRYRKSKRKAWRLLTKMTTGCCPPGLFPCDWTLEQVQDWRSKITICVLVAALSVLFAFLAFGSSILTCRPRSTVTIMADDFNARFSNSSGGTEHLVSIHGSVYDLGRLSEQGLHPPLPTIVSPAEFQKSLASRYGSDISFLFPLAISGPLNSCHLYGASSSFGKCSLSPTLDHCHYPQQSTDALQEILRSDVVIQYRWDMILSSKNLFVVGGIVMDVTDYLSQPINTSITYDEQALMGWIRAVVGKDATFSLKKVKNHRDLSRCLVSFFKVGEIAGQTNGCVASIVVDGVALIVWLLVALMRLGSALVYLFAFPGGVNRRAAGKTASDTVKSQGTSVLIFVHCNSSDSCKDIKATLESVVLSSQSRDKDLLVVVVEAARGSTHSLENSAWRACLGLMEMTTTTTKGQNPLTEKTILGTTQSDQVSRISLEGLVNGVEGHDHSQVLSGQYVLHSERVPYILVVKSRPFARQSAPSHSFHETKRLVLQLLYRSYHDLPMSFFEYELSEEIRKLTGNRPERYNLMLATHVGVQMHLNSVEQMMEMLENNDRVIAVCGRRVIQNPAENWITQIQNYHNLLTHQFGSSFESTLGKIQGMSNGLSLMRIHMTSRISGDRSSMRGRGERNRNSDATSILGDTYDDERGGRELGQGDHALVAGKNSVVANHRGNDLDENQSSLPVLMHPDMLLMPALVLSQWLLIALVTVGASQGSSGAMLLDSPPVMMTLAFVTLVMFYQLVLGILLVRGGTMSFSGLGLTILALPLTYLVVPLCALWSSEAPPEQSVSEQEQSTTADITMNEHDPHLHLQRKHLRYLSEWKTLEAV
ncbi:hypothetical protein BG004_003858 [Podila humilis]|nr:hypothetical protein BG004_003858 [Podila humilis]